MSGNRRKTILLCEDNSFIAISLEDALYAAGFSVAGPFTRCSLALDHIKFGHVDGAILDVALLDGSCVPLAQALSERGTPFIVHSGYNPNTAPLELRGVEWIEKPASDSVLVAALNRMLAGKAEST